MSCLPLKVGFWLLISALIAGRVAYYDRIVSPGSQIQNVTMPSAMRGHAIG